VTNGDYLAVRADAPKQVRLAMELEYRTLQRPEVDLIGWTTADIHRKEGGRVLRFRQPKTNRPIDIGIEGRLIDDAIGNVTPLRKSQVQPIIHTRKGEHYPDGDAQARPGESPPITCRSNASNCFVDTRARRRRRSTSRRAGGKLQSPTNSK
jgi:hypothetical protein